MAERPASRDPFELCGTTIIAKYRISELVGSGGFGVVYRGVHTDLGEPIAVKCLKSPAELGTEERDKLLANLRAEARTLHRLASLTSGIVRLLDVGAMTTARGQWLPYLVLEWLEGETLNEYLRKRAERGTRGMPLAEAVDLLEPAARALGVAHRQKPAVAHRDVKPDNLFVAEVGGKPTLKVLDFGIAKTMADASYTAAQNATMKQPSAFTPSYGAPEQFNKKRGPTGTWTDVFALALILVEVVSGERALDGDDPTQLYIAAADPAARPTLRHRGVETSDLVETVLRRALAIDPQDRFPDADAFWDALRDAIAGRSSQSPRADVSETGEFVTRNAMAVDVRSDALARDARSTVAQGGRGAADAAKAGAAAGDVAKAGRAGIAAGDAAQADDGARAAADAKAGPEARAAVEATERSRGAPSAAAAVSKDLGIQVLESDDDAATHRLAAGPAELAAAPAKRAGRAEADGPAPKRASDRPLAAGAGKARGDDTLPAGGSGDDAARGSPAAKQPNQANAAPENAGARAAAAKAGPKAVGPAERAKAAPARGRTGVDETAEPPSDPSDGPPSSSGRRFRIPWTLLIVIAALAGATLLYLELQYGNRPSTGEPGRTSQVTDSTRSVTTTSPVGPRPSSSVPTSSTTSSHTADTASSAAKDATAPIVPPPGMVYVPPPETDAGPNSHGYFIDRTEVTVKEYRDCVRAGSCEPADVVNVIEPLPPVLESVEKIAFAPGWTEVCNEKRGAGDHPVNCVKQAEARAYCKFRNKRLPSSAEYRLAAAGTHALPYPWGSDTPTCERACWGLNSQASCLHDGAKPATCAVTAKKDESPYGAMDLAGNVSEWADDFAEGEDGGAGRGIIFGGSFADEIPDLETSRARLVPAVTKFPTIGFRCARNAPPAQ